MSYVDIQVNGYAGVDFHVQITADQLQRVAARLRAGHVRVILPTITTQAISDMAARLENLHRIIQLDVELQQLMPAFHIEGPCLSPEDGYRGAHDVRYTVPASVDLYKRLFDAVDGPKQVAMVTLAPEVDEGLKATRWLVEQGVIVCVGHSNANLDTLKEAEQIGVQLFTHLGNGCPTLMPRHDNIIHRALNLERIKYSFIPDGQHLPWFVLRNWIRWVGPERCVFTTDCVTPADAPPGRYKVGRFDVEVGSDGVIIPPTKDHLVGSSLTMRQAYTNAIEYLGLSPVQARALCEEQPADLIAKWLPSR